MIHGSDILLDILQVNGRPAPLCGVRVYVCVSHVWLLLLKIIIFHFELLSCEGASLKNVLTELHSKFDG